MFTAHDAGHRGITHSMFADTLIGAIIADLLCGLSIGWWKSSHNVHHLITNHPVSPHSAIPDDGIHSKHAC
jgi:sphingolipid 8-(E)-desaturase